MRDSYEDRPSPSSPFTTLGAYNYALPVTIAKKNYALPITTSPPPLLHDLEELWTTQHFGMLKGHTKGFRRRYHPCFTSCKALAVLDVMLWACRAKDPGIKAELKAWGTRLFQVH
jgi:hypothetical protein